MGAENGTGFTHLQTGARSDGSDDLGFESSVNVIELANPNLPDITFGVNGVLTVTLVDDDPDPAPFIFADGFESGDVSGWTDSSP